MNKKSLLSAQNLAIGYCKENYNKTVLHSNITVDLLAGELTCLLGANGIGKSTLLRTLVGLQPPLSGDVMLGSKNITVFKDNELACRLGLVLTERASIGGLTVNEVVSMGRYPYSGFWGRLSRNDNRIIDEAMDNVCITHKRNAYVAELSDGERQKVMIAKALAQESSIIVLDEPTAFLDITSKIEIMNLLHYLTREYGKAILMSTHDVEQALILSDKLWLLSSNSLGLVYGVTEDMVMNNMMDSLFDNQTIHFDKETGSYLSSKKYLNEVFIECEDTILLQWTQNFLTRNRYSSTQEVQKAKFILKANHYNDLEIICEGKIKRFTSFEALMSEISEV